MKVALIHEWFSEVAGSEKCVAEFNTLYQQANVFALVDWLNNEQRAQVLDGKSVHTSFIQHLPFSEKKFRHYLPLFAFAIEQFDLTDYQLVLSSSHAVAKGVITHHEQLHVCYCHTPMRYAWDMYHQYLHDAKLEKGIKSWLIRYTLHRLRQWDVLSSSRVDHFIANSHYIKKRIKKVYNRDATVIYPPVNTTAFQLQTQKDNYYLAFSRLVPYKRIDLIVQAFANTRHKLIVVGNGPELDRLKTLATANIDFLGYQKDGVIIQLMQNAKALVFAALEDFGIIPVEAQACGTPVICLNQGGTAETVLSGQTGIHFAEQTVASIKNAIAVFEQQQDSFDPYFIQQFAQQFSTQQFRSNIANHLKQLMEMCQ